MGAFGVVVCGVLLACGVMVCGFGEMVCGVVGGVQDWVDGV